MNAISKELQEKETNDMILSKKVIDAISSCKKKVRDQEENIIPEIEKVLSHKPNFEYDQNDLNQRKRLSIVYKESNEHSLGNNLCNSNSESKL